MCRWFDSNRYHKQGDATVVRFRNREDKKPKCKDELLHPWTTTSHFAVKIVVVKYSSVVQRLERKTVNFDVAGSIPAGGAKLFVKTLYLLLTNKVNYEYIVRKNY